MQNVEWKKVCWINCNRINIQLTGMNIIPKKYSHSYIFTTKSYRLGLKKKRYCQFSPFINPVYFEVHKGGNKKVR